MFVLNRAVQYFDVTNKSSSYTVECVPEELEKKTTLLLYFARYMDEHLIQVSIWRNDYRINLPCFWIFIVTSMIIHPLYSFFNIIFLVLQGGHVELSKDSDDSWYGNIYLKKWFRTSKAIVLYLSDGTLQVQPWWQVTWLCKKRKIDSRDI